MSKQIVIKLGGSLLSRGEDSIFDFSYLEKLKAVLTDPELSDNKYFLAIGGGYTMRKYRDLAREAGIKSDIEIHWVGTTVNVLHAYLVKAYLSDIADDEVIKYEDYYADSERTRSETVAVSSSSVVNTDEEFNKFVIAKKIKVGGGSAVTTGEVVNKFTIAKKIRVGGGGRPGHSGDVDALLAAQKLGADTIISLKNVDAVYEADPKDFPEAKRIEKLSWDEYLKIIKDKDTHEPGGNYPIDPVASRMARSTGVRFVILSGDNLPNFASYLKGKEFVGSVVGR